MNAQEVATVCHVVANCHDIVSAGASRLFLHRAIAVLAIIAADCYFCRNFEHIACQNKC